MTRGVFALSVLTLLASAINYGSNVVFSRLLDPVGYGEWSSLLALAVILSVPTGAAQTVVAARVALLAADGRDDRIRYLLRHALAHICVFGAGVTILYAILIPLTVDVMNLRHAGPAIALIPIVFFSFAQPVVLGALQGLERFVMLGCLLVGMAASRIVVGGPLASLEHGAGSAIAGMAVGMAAVFVLSLWFLRRWIQRAGTGAASSGLRRRPDLKAVWATAAFVSFAVLSNFDLVLARIFLDSHDAGLYAAIATVGKLVIFMPAAVAVVMVPGATRARSEPGGGARVLRMSAAFVAGIAALVAVPAIIAPETLLGTMFGDQYRSAAGGVLPIVLAGTGLSLLNLLVVYTVAISDRRWPLVLFLGVALQTLAIALFHDSPTQVAYAQATAVVLVLVVNESWFHSLILRARRLDGVAPA